MSFIAAAIIGGGALIGGVASAIGSSNAASDQANAASNAQGISLNEFNTITGQESPYVGAGYGALNQLNYLLGVQPQSVPGYNGTIYSGVAGDGTTPSYGAGAAPTSAGGPLSGFVNPGTALYPQQALAQAAAGSGSIGSSQGSIASPQTSTAGGYGSLLTPFTASYMQQYSPAYQFQLQQGQQGVLNQDASSQGALSGAALKDLMSFNQNYANTAFNNAFNQYQTQTGNTYSRLAGIAQLGQSAAAGVGQQGTALAGQAAQSATNIGTAEAGGAVGVSNALGGTASNLGLIYALSQKPSSIPGV